jgi:hypothetical protein
VLNAGLATSRVRWYARTLAVCAITVSAIVSCVGIAAAVTLPNGRAYELVSPPAKNGGEVIVDPGRTRVAADGDAISFASLEGFGDVRGTGIATEYMSVRDGAAETNGWATHAITPSQNPFTLPAAFQAAEPEYFGDFSSDLSSGVFRAWSLLAPAPNVQRVENVYVRNDLRTPGPGSYELASDSVAPVGSATEPLANLVPPRVVGASRDFGHVLFESAYPLTTDATATSQPKRFNLYDWDHGTLHLAGILPDGSSAPWSVAGQGGSNGHYTQRTISGDGSRVFFTVGTGPGSNRGSLYMRVNDATTAQINASERTVPESAQGALFGAASEDGRRAFFVTQENLTDDAAGGDNKLYMYDASKPDTDPHNLTLLSVDHETSDIGNVQGVIGASDDGRHVYFIAAGQLVAGQPILNGGFGIYAWHDDGTPNGAIEYVGELADTSDSSFDLPSTYSLNPQRARVSPDGRRMLFMSHTGEGLLSAHGGTDYDHGNTCGITHDQACEEIYVYDADTQQLRCASCNPTGTPATADADDTVRVKGVGGSETTPHLNNPLSDDGRHVFFTTGEALVPQDTNGKLDAYEYDTSDGSVHLLSTGTDPSDSYFVDASSSGDDAFIATRARLVGWDTDQSYDIYDVRVHGGVPDPAPPAQGCAGEGCRGPLGLAPIPVLPGSSAITGDGNVKSTAHRSKPKPKPVKCRRGFVRKRVHGKVRCVKKPAARKPARAAHRRGSR